MVCTGDRNAPRNRILNAMSNADLALLQPHLDAVPLKFRQRLQSSNRAIRHVYFPESGIASVVEKMGLVRTARGNVTIMDRDGLEECANGLYATPEAEYERLLGSAEKGDACAASSTL
jgi:hypothetical protein